MKKFDLEDRLVEFASEILNLVKDFPKSFTASHLSKQLIRSSTSAALNYGESQAAESRADFIHKLKVALKELKETQICLRIINSQDFVQTKRISPLLIETNELVAIFISSIKTARVNKQKGKM